MKNTTLAEHTPGSWQVGSPIRSHDTLGIVREHNDGGEIIEETIAEVLPSSKPGQQAADARLIAAAPELLRDLYRLQFTLQTASVWDERTSELEWLRRIRAEAQSIIAEAIKRAVKS